MQEEIDMTTMTAAIQLLVTVGCVNGASDRGNQIQAIQPMELPLIEPTENDNSWRNDGTGYSFPGWEMGR